MSWKFDNPKTKGSSRGVASFEYSIVNEGEALRIAAENSSTNDKPPAAPNPLTQAGRNLQDLLSKLRPTNPPAQSTVRPKARVAR
jgi:hypothetical protein